MLGLASGFLSPLVGPRHWEAVVREGFFPCHQFSQSTPSLLGSIGHLPPTQVLKPGLSVTVIRAGFRPEFSFATFFPQLGVEGFGRRVCLSAREGAHFHLPPVTHSLELVFVFSWGSVICSAVVALWLGRPATQALFWLPFLKCLEAIWCLITLAFTEDKGAAILWATAACCWAA